MNELHETTGGETITVRLAAPSDRDALLALIAAYHAFEQIPHDADATARAIAPLLAQTDAGRIWLIEEGGQTVGYVALCFGYSIEFGGRDAFVDEMFLVEAARGRGLGKSALDRVADAARDLGVKALHLEVARANTRAQRLYSRLGFVLRDRYVLMSCTL